MRELIKRPLYGILAAYVLLTLAYGVVNPLFEAPDEHWHFFTAVAIKENGRLPIASADTDDNLLKQEAAQPPLYYALGALLIAPVDTSAAADEVWLNPYASVGDASALTNRNRAIHTPLEAWPWRGYALAAHILRIFSTLLGAGTLLFIYKSARLIWPHEPEYAWLGTAVIAFLPQFNFLHASITNDALIVFLSSAAAYQLLAFSDQYSVVSDRSNRLLNTDYRLLMTGITIGLAALSKNAGILLAVYAVGVVIGSWWLAAGRRSLTIDHWRLAIGNLLSLILPILLIAGWLWWRNWMLYGDITATNVFIYFAGGDREYTLGQVLAESGGLWQSLFAIFGWFNVRPPDWVFWLWNGVVGTAVLGTLKAMVNGQWSMANGQPKRWQLAIDHWQLAILNLAWFLLVYAGLLTFMLRTEAAQGRLLFPAIIPLAMALTYGLTRWRIRPFAPLLPITLALVSLYCLLFVITPVYALPRVVDALPASAQRLGTDMGDGLTLVGAEMETETAVPGEPIFLTLYWQAQTTPHSATPFKLELFGRDLTLIGELHSYQGRGLYPATLWPANAIIADRFGVYLDEEVTAPVLARLFVRLVDADAAGVEVGQVKVIPLSWPQTGPALAQFGDGVALTAVTLSTTTAHPGETITVDVTWRVFAPPGSDYTTLLHLAEAGQPPLAQGDRPPLNGDYPTHLWATEEVIQDQYEITIPAGLADGRYPLRIGLYDPTTLQRLPVSNDSQPQPDSTFLIETITVSP
ncbi:MAG: phospholipid carrier-dependent glycosyltransferase [Ardenticatenaceae bacterium]|nr:phospholipid carrier-dependent glycosyltransferase [Anaerolineales bacterium]MCB8922460.1 phospholipid carrier-dependent glycosyltransferase [Ardenticatenaceae bacterium]MCB8989929.1 phospholipid carrier-dependent glycosyltransferase [Ardenticatenaceae bacterium]